MAGGVSSFAFSIGTDVITVLLVLGGSHDDDHSSSSYKLQKKTAGPSHF